MLNLKGGEEEIYEELGQTQADGGVCGLVCDEDEDHGVDAQQGDQGQRRLCQPEMRRQVKRPKTNIQKDLMKKKKKKIYFAVPEFVVGVSHLVGSEL